MPTKKPSPGGEGGPLAVDEVLCKFRSEVTLSSKATPHQSSRRLPASPQGEAFGEQIPPLQGVTSSTSHTNKKRRLKRVYPTRKHKLKKKSFARKHRYQSS